MTLWELAQWAASREQDRARNRGSAGLTRAFLSLLRHNRSKAFHSETDSPHPHVA
jgi:hypothetical protein